LNGEAYRTSQYCRDQRPAIQQICDGILQIKRLVALTALSAVIVASAPVSAQQKPNTITSA